MSTARWRGVDKPGGSHFHSKPAPTGVECKRLRWIETDQEPFRCPGTLRRKHGKVWCADCQRYFTEGELKVRGIDPEKIK